MTTTPAAINASALRRARWPIRTFIAIKFKSRLPGIV
jgi:hypothetical protein